MSSLAIEAATQRTPASWSRRRFKSIVTRREERQGDRNLPMLSLASAGHLYPRAGSSDRQQAAEESLPRYLVVKEGDLVVNPMWLTGGSIAVSDVGGVVSPDYRVFEPQSAVEPRFLHHVLRADPYRDQYNLYVRANTTFDRRIQQIDLDNMPISLPQLDDQRRIADFLDDQVSRIDNIIVARQEQIELMAEHETSLIRQMVAGMGLQGASPSVSPLPWVPRFSDRAETRMLVRVLTLQRGVDLTDLERRPGSVPVITTAGVVGFHDQSIATGPGVVIGRYGSVGNVHWVDSPYWPHNTTLYVRDFHGNDPRWCYYLLKSYPYAALQARAAVPGINRNDMAGELVPWISLSDQIGAAVELDAAIDNQRAHVGALTASIALLTEYKQSLISAAVTGELDVTTASRRVPA